MSNLDGRFSLAHGSVVLLTPFASSAPFVLEVLVLPLDLFASLLCCGPILSLVLSQLLVLMCELKKHFCDCNQKKSLFDLRLEEYAKTTRT